MCCAAKVFCLIARVAELYKVETKRINEVVKNNPDKLPHDYVFYHRRRVCGLVVEILDHKICKDKSLLRPSLKKVCI